MEEKKRQVEHAITWCLRRMGGPEATRFRASNLRRAGWCFGVPGELGQQLELAERCCTLPMASNAKEHMDLLELSVLWLVQLASQTELSQSQPGPGGKGA